MDKFVQNKKQIPRDEAVCDLVVYSLPVSRPVGLLICMLILQDKIKYSLLKESAI
jgi:hypothetical protein